MCASLSLFTHSDFGNLRTITLWERILFCTKDAAIALRYWDSVNNIKLIE